MECMAKRNLFPSSRKSLIHTLILGLLFCTFVLLCLSSIVKKSLTLDESDHYRYGEQIFNLDSNRFDDSKMPFSVLNVLPVKLAEALFSEALDNVWQPIRIGRIATILFSAIIGLYIYKWSSDLFGRTPGLISLGLYLFEPNVIAHSRLMTTDIYATGMILICLYYFRCFLKNPTWTNALASSFVLGLSQPTKYTSTFLLYSNLF